MKRHLIYIVACGLLLAGCKTTEANYRAAYEKAKAKQTEGLTQEEIDGFAREESMPKYVYHGDSIPLKRMYANTVAETDETTPAPRYSVIVNAFAQRFNASSAIGRVRQAGYSDARMLIDRDKKYYVTVGGSESIDSALTLLHAVEANPPMAVRAPFPYIIEKIGNR